MKNVKTLKWLLTLACLLAALCAFTLAANAKIVDSGYCGAEGNGHNLTWTLDDAGMLIISGTGEMYDYNHYYDTDYTTAPWGGLRSNAKRVKTVVIENGVTSIGNYAFSHCKGLTSVTIPDSVTNIGTGVCCGCTELTSVTIPDSVTSIGYEAFRGCTGLTGVTIPDSVTNIGSYAFCGCTGLTVVTILDSVTNIGSHAFYGCTGLTSITIPESVKTIGEKAFYNCTKLKYLTVPDSVTSIGFLAFHRTAWYSNKPKGMVYIAKVAYCYQGTIPDNTSIMIKDGTESIAYGCFSNSKGLTSVSIPDSVTNIGEKAFYGCTGLTSVTIPGNVTSIGNEAFAWCTRLTSVTIPDSVTRISSSAFRGCTGLTSVTIPDSVTSIGPDAFYDCTGLTSVTIGNSVTRIWLGTFFGCTGLTSVTIPYSVTSIEDEAFLGCTRLTSVSIPDSVTEIAENAFPVKTVIYGVENSYAQQYAKNHGNRFVVICTGHLWDKSEIITPPTCTKFGVKNYTCSVCNGSKTEIIPAIGHSYGTWTRLDEILHQRVCANDNSHVEQENHIWDDGEIIIPSTCIIDGEKILTCSVCNGMKTEAIKATGHCWDAWRKLDDALHQRVCANDNKHVETADHEWYGGEITKAATCKEAGVKSYTCSVCGTTKTESIAKNTDHKWDDGKVTKAPTCKDEGVRTFTCTVCGKTKTEPVSAGGHKWGKWQPFDDEQHQRVCANDNSHVESAKHEWDAGIVSKAATCTADGEMTYCCTVCGASVTVPGDPATGHQWSAWTALNETSHRRVCGNNVTHIETADHSWDEGKVTKEATQTSEGERTFTCLDCGATRIETIPKLTPAQPTQAPGDADGDGKLTSADARLALRASVGLTEKDDVVKDSAGYLACDVDGDGKVSSADARLILRASVGLEDASKFGKKA